SNGNRASPAWVGASRWRFETVLDDAIANRVARDAEADSRPGHIPSGLVQRAEHLIALPGLDPGIERGPGRGGRGGPGAEGGGLGRQIQHVWSDVRRLDQ